MNDIEFSPCYRCGGKVICDFLGRIRCTKCGYDFKTMSVDPDFEPEEDICEFCERFNFLNTGIDINKYGVSIFTTCSGDCEVPKEKRFNYCPMCGRELRGADNG